MKAMILAAGLGTRLKPLTDLLPKPLLPVAGQPLLLWNLLLLRQAGVRQVVINLHHLGHLIEQAVGDGSRWGLQVTYSQESTLLGTGGGLKQVEDVFQGAPFLVLNGDTLIEVDLEALVRFHEQGVACHGRVAATLVVRDDPEVDRWGPVEMDAGNRVLRINGKGVPAGSVGQAVARRMFAGVHVVDPRVLQDVPRGQPSSIIDAYVTNLARGAVLLGYAMTGYWSDVGTPERYAQVQRDSEAGRIDLARRHAGA